jgi:aromatic ring-cleaving dioxygenase
MFKNILECWNKIVPKLLIHQNGNLALLHPKRKAVHPRLPFKNKFQGQLVKWCLLKDQQMKILTNFKDKNRYQFQLLRASSSKRISKRGVLKFY